MTYHTDNTHSNKGIANFVYSLKEEDITKRLALRPQQKILERVSLENSREQSQQQELVRVPSGMRRHRGPPEEELSPELNERVKEKFGKNDHENSGNINVECLSVMLSELELADEEEDEGVMEEAFQGILDEDRDNIRYEEFLTIARRLYYRKKLEEDKKKMADISEE